MNTLLSEILTEDQVLIDTQATDRWEIIDELIGHLARTSKIKPENFACITAAVKKRELAMSTGIGSGIGYPHATTSLVHRVIAALGLSSKGINFEALDGEPVTIVILFLVPPHYFREHLRTLAKITRLLHRPDFRLALNLVSNAATVIQLFRMFEAVPVEGERHAPE